MSDNSNIGYGEDDWSQCVDESESDIGSRSTSSTLSWTDEAEKGISEEMKNQYELFESALYSELDGEELPEPLLQEVAVWKQHSPHLRITGTQITPTFHEVEDNYPEDYEEVFAAHSSDNEDIIEQFKEQCAVSNNSETKSKVKGTDTLFEKLWPDLKNEETIVHSENHYKTSPKNENQSFHILEDTLEIVEPPVHRARRAPLSSRGCVNRHEFKCNHITEHEESTDHNFKPPSCRQRKLSPAKMQRRNLSSSFSASRASRRVSTAASARLPKRKSLVSESTQKISHLTESSDTGSFRHGILPPIQTIALTPKLPSKRANSAMLRFSKTLPRTRPNTSKNKPIWLTPIDDSDQHDKYNGQKESEVLPRGDGHLSPLAPSLPYCTASKKNKQLKIPRRWRY